MTTDSTKYSAVRRWERVATPDFYDHEIAVRAAIDATDEEFEREAEKLHALKGDLENRHRAGEFGYAEWCKLAEQASRDFYALPFHALRDAAIEAANSRLKERVAAIRDELGAAADDIVGFPV
jgi:hypothetical protein